MELDVLSRDLCCESRDKASRQSVVDRGELLIGFEM